MGLCFAGYAGWLCCIQGGLEADSRRRQSDVEALVPVDDSSLCSARSSSLTGHGVVYTVNMNGMILCMSIHAERTAPISVDVDLLNRRSGIHIDICAVNSEIYVLMPRSLLSIAPVSSMPRHMP